MYLFKDKHTRTVKYHAYFEAKNSFILRLDCKKITSGCYHNKFCVILTCVAYMSERVVLTWHHMYLCKSHEVIFQFYFNGTAFHYGFYDKLINFLLHSNRIKPNVYFCITFETVLKFCVSWILTKKVRIIFLTFNNL